jgi:hypothetical protein
MGIWRQHMKIQLERNLRSGSGKLRCLVCEAVYGGKRLRMLLCHNDGSIGGDVCASCLKLTPAQIQHRLRQRAVVLIKQPPIDNRTPSPQKQALELFELAQQPLAIPPFYVWWWKQFSLLAVEAGELESARTAAASCYRHPKPLKLSLLTEEPSIGQDN